MTVEHMDFRVGGTWRWVARGSEGDAPFSGEYLEIVPFERIVHTEMFDVEPFNQGEPAHVTVTLETVEGGTKLTSRSRFPSAEALEGALRNRHDRWRDRVVGSPRRGDRYDLTEAWRQSADRRAIGPGGLRVWIAFV